jgi:AcrR family transcriptional regulator
MRKVVLMAEAPDRRERKKQRTRLAIRTAALDLFAERGYRDTTISDIADRADVATRTVTLHFPTKEELLFAVEPFALELLADRLSSRGDNESALDALRDWNSNALIPRVAALSAVIGLR